MNPLFKEITERVKQNFAEFIKRRNEGLPTSAYVLKEIDQKHQEYFDKIFDDKLTPKNRYETIYASSLKSNIKEYRKTGKLEDLDSVSFAYYAYSECRHYSDEAVREMEVKKNLKDPMDITKCVSNQAYWKEQMKANHHFFTAKLDFFAEKLIEAGNRLKQRNETIEKLEEEKEKIKSIMKKLMADKDSIHKKEMEDLNLIHDETVRFFEEIVLEKDSEIDKLKAKVNELEILNLKLKAEAEFKNLDKKDDDSTNPTIKKEIRELKKQVDNLQIKIEENDPKDILQQLMNVKIDIKQEIVECKLILDKQKNTTSEVEIKSIEIINKMNEIIDNNNTRQKELNETLIEVGESLKEQKKGIDIAKRDLLNVRALTEKTSNDLFNLVLASRNLHKDLEFELQKVKEANSQIIKVTTGFDAAYEEFQNKTADFALSVINEARDNMDQNRLFLKHQVTRFENYVDDKLKTDVKNTIKVLALEEITKLESHGIERWNDLIIEVSGIQENLEQTKKTLKDTLNKNLDTIEKIAIMEPKIDQMETHIGSFFLKEAEIKKINKDLDDKIELLNNLSHKETFLDTLLPEMKKEIQRQLNLIINNKNKAIQKKASILLSEPIPGMKPDRINLDLVDESKDTYEYAWKRFGSRGIKPKSYLSPLKRMPYVQEMTYEEWSWQKNQNMRVGCNIQMKSCAEIIQEFGLKSNNS